MAARKLVRAVHCHNPYRHDWRHTGKTFSRVRMENNPRAQAVHRQRLSGVEEPDTRRGSGMRPWGSKPASAPVPNHSREKAARPKLGRLPFFVPAWSLNWLTPSASLTRCKNPPHKKPLSSLLEKSDRVAREGLPMPRTAASTLPESRPEVRPHGSVPDRPFLPNPPYTFAAGFVPQGLEGLSPRW